jgi:predicted nucleotidyltransferase component of viral defense system
MTSRRTPKDIAASVRQRLLNKAHESERPFNELLQYYAMERFLFRLGVSEYSRKFVLKGALVFTAWGAPISRPTMDIDLLGSTDNAIDKVMGIVRDICATDVEADGLEFDARSVRAERIAEGADYEGIRVKFRGHLGTARVGMQLDIGFGDVVVPRALEVVYPTILDMSPPRIRCYSREAIIAEKFDAITKLGIVNSRMKDFYDIWFLSRVYEFDGKVLSTAIAKTFARRNTEIQPATIAFTDAFVQDPTKQKQWKAFIRKSRMENVPVQLGEVIGCLVLFLGPVAEALASGGSFSKVWKPPGPWS